MDTQQARPQGTNALAVGSLISGLLWFGGLGSIVAIVLGNQAQNEIRATGQPGEGLAKAGILLGWIGIATSIIAFVAVVAGGITLFSNASEGREFIPRGAERMAAQMNATSALKAASRRQDVLHEKNGTYSDDWVLVTNRSNWEGVDLEIIRADESAFCIETRHQDLDRVWHMTETSARPMAGAC